MKRIIKLLSIAFITFFLFGQVIHAKTVKYDSSRSISFNWEWNLFAENASNGRENHALSVASVYLCRGTYGGASEIYKRIKNLGFLSVDTTYFTKYAYDNQANTSPIAFGSKISNINNKKCLIVVVVIRGTYWKEGNYWDLITNFRSGFFNVDGFFEAGETGREATENYIKQQQKISKLGKKNTIVLITGHSLGGVIAGQIARALQHDNLADQNHIFGYTFASPFYKTYGDENKYKNIHNFINKKDDIPKFPLGGNRNGIDHFFTVKEDAHALDTYLDGVISYFNNKKTGGGSGRGDVIKGITIKGITLNKKSATIIKGNSYKLIATVKGINGSVHWLSSRSDVASVDSSGKVTGKKVGKATVTAKCRNFSAKCEITVTTRKAGNSSNGKVKVAATTGRAGNSSKGKIKVAATTGRAGNSSNGKLSSVKIRYYALTYTGKSLTQNKTTIVKGKSKNRTITLKEGKDYTISYKNNKKVGEATMIVKGTGGYSGTIKKTFLILPSYFYGVDRGMNGERGSGLALEKNLTYSYYWYKKWSWPSRTDFHTSKGQFSGLKKIKPHVYSLKLVKYTPVKKSTYKKGGRNYVWSKSGILRKTSKSFLILLPGASKSELRSDMYWLLNESRYDAVSNNKLKRCVINYSSEGNKYRNNYFIGAKKNVSKKPWER